ncbi:ethylmalonyl-CoA decarboxylase isoform X2 [Limanda limanda]|uniref:ethylmalonyl-CoA decarboxylase isoform X2 n=1 Tax=Limanda limanda TaxID=27771 RepID=UPI0029C734D3|nr:ethylmalonyl-CoA decarboxylase isoform X2 [Limanda limanda]XP_060937216.1 ethylmalonyl-CoA decarboxylase isoform X2 [Limanda limanda]
MMWDVYSRMTLWALRQQLLRGSSSCGAWGRLLQRQSSGCVYSNIHGYDQLEVREKLQAFPGGSIDLLQQDSGVAVLTIHHPTRMNALSGSMMVELEEHVSQLENWTEGKGLIVQGAAGTFCSGSDLSAVRAISNPQDGMKMCMFMQNALTRLLRLPLISVALVEGRALGGGAEFTTACDFRLMASGSVIQFVHKHMGLVPGWGGATRLVHIVGSQHALKLLGGALKVDPELGLQIGLADGVLEDPRAEEGAGTPLQQAEKWLSSYINGPAAVIQAVKKVVLSGRELPLSEALRAEKDVFGTVWGGPANLQALASKSKHK